MLRTYRTALVLPGAARFSGTGFVARLPVAMIGLAIVLLVSERTGSYAAAGVLSAAFQLPAALGAVMTSRWADRLGQSRLLPWLVLTHGLFLVMFVIAVEQGSSLILQAVVIALAGLSQPAIGAMVRARWAAVATDETVLRSAFAWESVVDELVFSIGPPITAFVAFNIGLPLPLILASALAVVGGLALSMQRRTQPPPRARTGHDESEPRGGALRQPGMAYVVIAALGIGSVFGSYEVAVVAFTEEAGRAEMSGLILGLWAFGSMVGGIWFGSRHWRTSLGRQMLVLPALLSVALLPTLATASIGMLVLVTTIGGVAIAPTLIASFSLTERLVPSRWLTEGLTWTNSGLAMGFSAGTATTGFLVDSFGTVAGFAISVAGALFATVVGALAQPVYRRVAQRRESVPLRIPLVDDPLPGPQPGGIDDDSP